MNRFLLLTFTTFLAAGSLLQSPCFAQVSLGISPYRQDFNAIGSGLPAGWTVRTGATPNSLGNPVSFNAAVLAWTNTTGNFKNFAGAEGLTISSPTVVQNASGNRALGVRQTGTLGDPGAAFVFQLSQTSGMTNFFLRFKLQSLDGSATGRTTTWKVDYGFGDAPSSFIQADTNPAPLTVALSPTGWGSTDVGIDFGTSLDNHPGNVWIRIATLTATTGSGSRPSMAIDDFTLSFLKDVTPPVYTHSLPRISNITSSGFDISTGLDEPGKTCFVVLPKGAPAPNSFQIASGLDASGNPLLAGFFGVMDVVLSSTEYTMTLSSLASDADYEVYVASKDNQFNLQPVPVTMMVRTLPKDTISPEFLPFYPRVDLIYPTGFTILTRLNESGAIYFVIVPQGDPAPTSEQVKSGKDANDLVINPNLTGSGIIEDTETEVAFAVTGLRDDTPYDIYVIAEDMTLNLQGIPSKVTVSTGKVFVENFDNCGVENSFTQFSVTGSQVWGCTDFGRNSKAMRVNGFSGAAFTNEDWLISPRVKLGDHPGLSFYSQFSFTGNALQLKISTDYSGSGDPAFATWSDINGEFPVVPVASSSTLSSDWTYSVVDLSAHARQAVYVAFVYTSTGSKAARWTLDEVTFGNASASYLLTTPSVLSLRSDAPGNYLIKGFGLTDEVTVTAPGGFEVSRDNRNFSRSISYTAIEAVAGQKVHVRFMPSADAGVVSTGFVSNMAVGAATRDVYVRGAQVALTFDVATFNLNFFGSDVRSISGTEFGPANDELQIKNVASVLQAIKADIIAVQEVSNDDAFRNLVASLPGYEMVLSNRWSYSFDPPDPYFPPQKIGLIYNASTVQMVSSRVLFEKLYDDIRAGSVTLPQYPGGNGAGFWSSGRLPLMVLLNVTINEIERQVRVIVIHAKSGATPMDFDRRRYDVNVLHDSIASQYPNDPIILLGDFNDDVDESVGVPSSYQSFVDDTDNFNSLTYALSQTGASSFPGSGSFLDHIVISNELTDAAVKDGVFIEEAGTYISGYANTTSDHLPVVARFQFKKTDQEITFHTLPDRTFGDAPFLATAIASSGLEVTFASPSDKLVVHGSLITILKPGRAKILAFQTGNRNFNAAGPVGREFCIRPERPRVVMSGDNNETRVLVSSAQEGNQWFLNGTVLDGETSVTLQVSTLGQYSVQSTIDDCTSVRSDDLPVIFTGDLAYAGRMSLYPNPVVDYLELSGIEDSVKDARLFDMVGRLNSIELEKKGLNFVGSTGHLPPGMYVLLVDTGSGVHQAKFMKR